MKRVPIRRRRRGARRGPERDRAYLAFVHEFPCLICGAFPVEAAHMGPHGFAQKASDYSCLPLCSVCHRTGKYAHHVLGRNWAAHHGVDVAVEQARLRADYENRRMAA